MNLASLPKDASAPRICHVVGHLNFGGAERQIVNLLNALISLRPTLILTTDHQNNDLLPQLDRAVRVVQNPCRLARMPFDVHRLAQLLRKLRIDVLHSHMFWPNLYAARAAVAASVPVFVTTEHGINPWKRPWHRWLERHVISRRAQRRICVSDDIRRMRIQEDRLPPSQLVVIPNGTPIPARGRDERPMANPVLLLAVGRLVPAKDFPTLLRAIRHLRKDGYHVLLRIAGEGPLRSELEQLARSLDVVANVQFLGNRPDVQELLQSSDVFVMSSRREGQPLVLLEAMAAEIPIVATTAGGIPNTVRSGVEALLVPAGDHVALAAALEQLITDPAQARALAQNAKRRVTTDFSIEAIASAHLDLYAQCLSEMRS